MLSERSTSAFLKSRMAAIHYEPSRRRKAPLMPAKAGIQCLKGSFATVVLILRPLDSGTPLADIRDFRQFGACKFRMRLPRALKRTHVVIPESGPPPQDESIQSFQIADTRPLPVPHARSIMYSSREIGHPVLPEVIPRSNTANPSEPKSHNRLRQDLCPVNI